MSPPVHFKNPLHYLCKSRGNPGVINGSPAHPSQLYREESLEGHGDSVCFSPPRHRWCQILDNNNIIKKKPELLIMHSTLGASSKVRASSTCSQMQMLVFSCTGWHFLSYFYYTCLFTLAFEREKSSFHSELLRIIMSTLLWYTHVHVAVLGITTCIWRNFQGHYHRNHVLLLFLRILCYLAEPSGRT